MYSRKFHQSLFQAKPNIRSAILECNITSRNFYKYSIYIQKYTATDTFKILQSLHLRLNNFLKNDKLYKLIKSRIISVPRNLKDQSSKILGLWAHQCECVIAQRLRRSQQMFCLYSKLWEEHALKELLSQMRIQICRHSKELILGAVGITTVNWNNIRITDDQMLSHISELEYIYKLKSHTVLCKDCDSKNLATCACPIDRNEILIYDNWTLFIQKDDLLVWRRPNPGGSFEYKVYGVYNDVTAEDFLNVQVDIEYRKHWDNTAIQLELIEADPNVDTNAELVYWEMLWPRLFSNRDYVFQRRYKVDFKSRTAIIVNQSTEHPKYPLRSDKYRIKDYWSYMVIRPNNDFKEPGIEFGLTYYDNPGVNIPASVTAWVAMRAMPDYLANLRQAARKYADYCKETEHPCIWSVFREKQKQPPEDKSHPKGKSEKTAKCTGECECIKKKPGCSPGSEIMTSPSPMTQHDNSKSDYWKYLKPNYYMS